MNQLQRIINLNLNQKLKTEETFALLNEYLGIFVSKGTNMGINSLGENMGINSLRANNVFALNSKFVRTCIVGLENNKIDPNDFLTAAVSYSTIVNCIPMIALALRYGANPNLYVIYKNRGVVHIMYYATEFLRASGVNDELITLVLCVLSLGGSYSSSRVRSLTSESKDSESIGSVAEYLYESGFYDFSDPVSYVKENLSLDDQINIGAMLDIPEIAFPQGFNKKTVVQSINEYGAINNITKEEPLPGPDLSQVIIYNSYKCLPHINLTFRYKNGEVLELRMCIEGIGLEAFKFLFDKGYKMTYFSLNRLLLGIRDSKKSSISDVGNIVPEENFISSRVTTVIYLEMLKHAINKGMRMDLQQLGLLTSISSEYASQIEEIYSNPLWVKSCSASDNVPLPKVIKELAFSLNLGIKEEDMEYIPEASDSTSERTRESVLRGDLSPPGASQKLLTTSERTRESVLKQKICSSLREVSRVNKDLYIEENMERQKDRIRIETLATRCANSNTMDYSDDALVFYKDESNKTWCFTPNMYEDLIKTGVNSYTGKKLPSKVKIKMIQILDYMKSLNINPNKVSTVSTAIEKLNSPDMISNEYTDIAINFLKSTASLEGIFPAQIEGLKFDKMNYILENIDFKLDYFGELYKISPSLAFNTFAKAIYVFIKRYNDIQRMEMNIPGLPFIFDVIKS